MSLFEVNTEELNHLADRLQGLSDLLNKGDGLPAISKSIGSIRSLLGLNMSTHKASLSAVYATMRDLSDDLELLGKVLGKVSQISQGADAKAGAIFSGSLPQRKSGESTRKTENSRTPYQFDEDSMAKLRSFHWKKRRKTKKGSVSLESPLRSLFYRSARLLCFRA